MPASAKDYFIENIKLLGRAAPQQKPIEYNLYAGLAQLAEDVEKVSRQLDNIKRKLQGTAAW